MLCSVTVGSLSQEEEGRVGGVREGRSRPRAARPGPRPTGVPSPRPQQAFSASFLLVSCYTPSSWSGRCMFMLVTLLETRVDATGVPPTSIPKDPTTQAYTSVLGSAGAPVQRWFANGVVAAAANSALVVTTAASRPTRWRACGSAAGAWPSA